MNGWVSAGKDSYVPDIFEMITKPGIDFADARNWPPMGNKSLSGYQKKRLFHNEGGAGFKDQAARHGLDSMRDGRGVAVADFDNDGRLDLFVANANGLPFLYRNTLPAGPSLGRSSCSRGPESNRDGVGAQVRLTAGGRTHLRFVNGGNGFAGQSSARVHFGLGASDDDRPPRGALAVGREQTVRQLRRRSHLQDRRRRAPSGQVQARRNRVTADGDRGSRADRSVAAARSA